MDKRPKLTLSLTSVYLKSAVVVLFITAISLFAYGGYLVKGNNLTYTPFSLKVGSFCAVLCLLTFVVDNLFMKPRIRTDKIVIVFFGITLILVFAFIFLAADFQIYA